MNGTRTHLTPGAVYGRWTLLAELGRDHHGHRRWLTRCECGTIGSPSAVNLIRAVRPSRSCGCLKSELARQPRTDVPTYDGVHRRIRTANGPARDHACADCAQPANEWSLNVIPDDPQTWTTPAGYRVVYSLNIGDYVPRCWSCHRTRDYHQHQAAA